MSKFWNKRATRAEPYIPGEQPRERSIIKLNTNENPYPPPKTVIRALKKAAGSSLRLYPDPACADLRRAIGERFGIDSDYVFVGNGSDEVLAFAFGAFFASRGDCGAEEPPPVLFPDISYSFYRVYAQLWDIPHKQIDLNDDFCINIDDYAGKAGGIVIANPNAPTGIALEPKLIASLAERQSDIVTIVDEAYYGFGAESIVPLIKHNKTIVAPNILAVHTLSKNASLAGLRAGFAIGSAELIKGLERTRDSFNSYTMDRLAQAGAAAALQSVAYYKTINAKIARTRDRVTKTLAAMGWTVLPSSANFIFVRPVGINGEDLFNKLRQNNIIVRYFNKDRIKDFVRVTIGKDRDMDAFLQVCKL
jgi:histidinol-phosphate aminotransferase